MKEVFGDAPRSPPPPREQCRLGNEPFYDAFMLGFGAVAPTKPVPTSPGKQRRSVSRSLMMSGHSTRWLTFSRREKSPASRRQPAELLQGEGSKLEATVSVSPANTKIDPITAQQPTIARTVVGTQQLLEKSLDCRQILRLIDRP